HALPLRLLAKLRALERRAVGTRQLQGGCAQPHHVVGVSRAYRGKIAIAPVGTVTEADLACLNCADVEALGSLSITDLSGSEALRADIIDRMQQPVALVLAARRADG